MPKYRKEIEEGKHVVEVAVPAVEERNATVVEANLFLKYFPQLRAMFLCPLLRHLLSADDCKFPMLSSHALHSTFQFSENIE